MYSGYLFEEIQNKEYGQEILSEIDILVDGEFVKERKNLKLKFRGSDNQRIIDVKKTLKTGQIVLAEKYIT
jgi:anaerobic ribonucleoside-triphosphate reductase activating protein